MTPIHLLLGSVNITCYVGAKEYMNASWATLYFFGSLNKGMKRTPLSLDTHFYNCVLPFANEK